MAPDKIYIADNIFPTHVDWDGSPINTKRIEFSDIEYIRKDALLEWVKKELESAEITNFDEFGKGEVITWTRVLDKLNSM